jgi:hypothetical protein
MTTKHDFRSLLIFALILLSLSPVAAQSSVGDLLLYFDSNREPPGITAYNPTNGEELQLPVRSGVEGIKTSGDGRIAYIQDNDVWVLDVLNAPNNPINITQTPDEEESLINWTPNGDLLQYRVGSSPGPYLFYTYDGNGVIAVGYGYGYKLNRYWNEDAWYVASDGDNTDSSDWYIWNGRERFNLEFPVLSAEPVWQTFLWTPNNHLFITIGYREQEYNQPIGATQVFYWNGNAVREVIRPSEAETFMLDAWSADGRLTLYTDSDGSIPRWYIWDGVSFTPDGIPDTSTLTAINSPMEYIQDIEWMPDGRLAIAAKSDSESDSLLGHSFSCVDPCAVQVYLWDEQTLVPVISRDSNYFWIDVHDSGNIAVSYSNGLVTSAVVVFDINLEPVFQSGGPSRWSADGNLAYCRGNGLFVWNGQEAVQLSYSIFSKWLIAQSRTLVCYTG